MSPERRALFLAGQHCQGGHSEAGAAIAETLGVPFPLDMADLVARARAEGENPAALYPWLVKMGQPHSKRARHRFFTPDEIAGMDATRAAP